MNNSELAERWPHLFKTMDDPDWECRGSMHQPFEADVRAKLREDEIREALRLGAQARRACEQSWRIVPHRPRKRYK